MSVDENARQLMSGYIKHYRIYNEIKTLLNACHIAGTYCIPHTGSHLNVTGPVRAMNILKEPEELRKLLQVRRGARIKAISG